MRFAYCALHAGDRGRALARTGPAAGHRRQGRALQPLVSEDV